MNILTRVERTINLNHACIEELLDKYATTPMATAFTVDRDDVLIAVQKLQEANSSLVILRASIRAEKDAYADDQP